MVVAADVCDMLDYTEPLITCVAEDDFAELTTQYKQVNPQGVFTSLAQTAFEKAGQQLARSVGTVALRPPDYRFEGVEGDMTPADTTSAAQRVYAALLPAHRADVRIGFNPPVRHLFYTHCSNYFTDYSYYVLDQQRETQMERWLHARAVAPSVVSPSRLSVHRPPRGPLLPRRV